MQNKIRNLLRRRYTLLGTALSPPSERLVATHSASLSFAGLRNHARSTCVSFLEAYTGFDYLIDSAIDLTFWTYAREWLYENKALSQSPRSAPEEASR